MLQSKCSDLQRSNDLLMQERLTRDNEKSEIVNSYEQEIQLMRGHLTKKEIEIQEMQESMQVMREADSFPGQDTSHQFIQFAP